jgi:hypothetical protein
VPGSNLGTTPSPPTKVVVVRINGDDERCFIFMRIVKVRFDPLTSSCVNQTGYYLDLKKKTVIPSGFSAVWWSVRAN